MREYRVTWEVDVDAESPEEAAEKALEIQRDPHSQAVVFDVWTQDEATGETGRYKVDLLEQDPEERVVFLG